jgi:hypothetical protein
MELHRQRSQPAQTVLSIGNVKDKSRSTITALRELFHSIPSVPAIDPGPSPTRDSTRRNSPYNTNQAGTHEVQVTEGQPENQTHSNLNDHIDCDLASTLSSGASKSTTNCLNSPVSNNSTATSCDSTNLGPSSPTAATSENGSKIIKIGKKAFFSSNMEIEPRISRLWEEEISGRLGDALHHTRSGQASYVTLELLMAGPKGTDLKPTIVITCRSNAF